MYKQLPCRIDCLVAFQYKYFQGEPDDCWPWIHRFNADKYGILSINGKLYQATRVSFYLHYGYLNQNLEILHSCNNPPCVNPNHLSENTHKENIHQMIKQNRQYKYNGENTKINKVTLQQVIEIRYKHYENNYSIKQLSEIYNIHYSTVLRIIRNKTWKFAKGPTSEKTIYGENHHNAHHTEKEILEIRFKWATGKYTQNQLANEYNVSQQYIEKIVNKRIWKHI